MKKVLRVPGLLKVPEFLDNKTISSTVPWYISSIFLVMAIRGGEVYGLIMMEIKNGGGELPWM